MYRDGKLLKGYTNDFFPNKPAFHIQPGDETVGQSIEATISQLEVHRCHRERTEVRILCQGLQGGPGYTARRFEESDRPTGRKVEVTFYDGEVIVGATMGYDPKRIGFFVLLIANNPRVFVVNKAVKQFRYL